MTGTKNYYVYTDDSGSSYVVQLSKSNSEATVNGIPVMGKYVSILPTLPVGFKMRYVMASLVGDPSVKRKFYIGSVATIKEILSTSQMLRARRYPTMEPSEWNVTFYRGEKVRLVPALSQLEISLFERENP
jgi:hypothetical protein